MAKEFTVRLADGRQLEVVIDGPAKGLPLIFHGGAPSAAILYPPLVNEAARKDLRTVTYSRPGYSQSTTKKGRSVADCAADVSAILEEIDANEFVTIGWSGGGPHALACAALLPERCGSAVSLAGVAPYSAGGLDWMAGMGQENVEEFSLAAEGEEALVPFLEKASKELSDLKGSEVAASLAGLVSQVDRSALARFPDYADFLAASLRKSVSTGVEGWRDDDLAFVKDWGFELDQIERPVAVWQGDEDRMVPFTHGQWLAEHIPNARIQLHRGEGHLSLGLAAFDRILEDLLALAR